VVLTSSVSYVLDKCSRREWFVLEQSVDYVVDMGRQHDDSIRNDRQQTSQSPAGTSCEGLDRRR
jgi:hypothetical protein